MGFLSFILSILLITFNAAISIRSLFSPTYFEEYKASSNDLLSVHTCTAHFSIREASPNCKKKLVSAKYSALKLSPYADISILLLVGFLSFMLSILLIAIMITLSSRRLI